MRASGGKGADGHQINSGKAAAKRETNGERRRMRLRKAVAKRGLSSGSTLDDYQMSGGKPSAKWGLSS
ncbi:UNVERIFIED_CONTAM: hypothetical protein Sangu_1179900 [Sesamum angustifolium]|uniref:Uncharacterized protein n=1 Tax=Sesamum angustifolium TaxID=2727405 RepID=A0AAW2NJE5_9LAMI